MRIRNFTQNRSQISLAHWQRPQFISPASNSWPNETWERGGRELAQAPWQLSREPVSLSWRRQWHPSLLLLPGKSHGRRSLAGCSPWGHKELDTTQRLHFHFSLSCNGEWNGNPLQCSCLENPRDRGAWWAAIYGVTQSQTRLKRLSSSSLVRWIFFIIYFIVKELEAQQD